MIFDVEIQWKPARSNSDEGPYTRVRGVLSKLQYRVLADGHSAEWRDVEITKEEDHE